MKNHKSATNSLLFNVAAIVTFVLFFIGNTGTNLANQQGSPGAIASKLYANTFGSAPHSDPSTSLQFCSDGLDPLPVPPVPPPQATLTIEQR